MSHIADDNSSDRFVLRPEAHLTSDNAEPLDLCLGVNQPDEITCI